MYFGVVSTPRITIADTTPNGGIVEKLDVSI
jgi:hypothetical protein